MCFVNAFELDTPEYFCPSFVEEITQEMTEIKIINPIDIQCQAAVDYALSES